jgi:hypothetical protein
MATRCKEITGMGIFKRSNWPDKREHICSQSSGTL